MKRNPLESQTKALLGVSLKLALDFTDFNGTGVASQANDNFSAAWTSGTAQAIEPVTYVAGTNNQTIAIGVATNTLPAGMKVSGAILNVLIPFTSSAGTITTLTLALGDTGTTNKFLAATDLKTAAYTYTAAAATIENAAFTIVGVLTISGQTIASLNAGYLEIYLNLEPISDLTKVL